MSRLDEIIAQTEQRLHGGAAPVAPSDMTAESAWRVAGPNVSGGVRSASGPSTLEIIEAEIQRRAAASSRGMEIRADGGDVLGRIDVTQDGRPTFVGSSWSTSDPEHVRRILQGEDPRAISREFWRDDFQRGVIAERPISSRAAAAIRGVPFAGEWADEAVGAMFGDTARDTMRLSQEAVAEQEPVANALMQIGTGVAASIPMVAAMGPEVAQRAATSLGGRVVQGLGLGGVLGGTEGAVSGAGRANEGDRFGGATDGAVIGGILGAGAGAGIPLVGEAVRSGFDALSGPAQPAIVGALGVGPAAAGYIRRALDGEDLTAAVQAVDRAGPRATLADAGQSTLAALDGAVASGGEATRAGIGAARSRTQTGAAELTRTLNRILGVPEGVTAAQRGIRSSTASVRSPAYEEAYQQAIDYSGRAGRRLLEILENVPMRYIRQANEDLRIAFRDRPVPPQIMASVGDNGRVTYQRLPGVADIDYITRALQDVVQGQSAGVMGGINNTARMLQGVITDLRDIVRTQVPAYNRALASAADTTGRVRAVEVGSRLLQMPRDEAAFAVRNMTAAERTAARQGLRSHIDDTMARVQATFGDPNVDGNAIREAGRALLSLSSRQARTNIEQLVGAQRARALFSTLDRVGADFQMQAAIASGSRTAIRESLQAFMRDMTGPRGVADTLAQTGSPSAAGRALVQRLMGAVPHNQSAASMDAMAEVVQALTQRRGSGEAMRLVRLLDNAMGGQRITDRRAAELARLVSEGLGLTAYQAGTQYQAR